MVTAALTGSTLVFRSHATNRILHGQGNQEPDLADHKVRDDMSTTMDYSAKLVATSHAERYWTRLHGKVKCPGECGAAE